MVLAARLSVAVLACLVEVTTAEDGSAARHRGLAWATAAISEHACADVPTATYERLVDALADEAERSRTGAFPTEPSSRLAHRMRQGQDERDGPGWKWVRRLAALPLPVDLRARRDDRLRACILTGEQRLIADALHLLTDAETDDEARLSEEAVTACTALVDLALPEMKREQRERTSRRAPFVIGTGPRLLSGHVEAAALLARRREMLSDDVVQVLHRLAGYERWDRVSIRSSLEGAGKPVPAWSWSRSMQGALAGIGNQPFRWFYEAASASGLPVGLDRRSRWDLIEIADVAEEMGLARSSIGDLKAGAAADPHDVTFLVGALADAHGVDRGHLAAHAQHVLKALDAGDNWPDQVVRTRRLLGPATVQARHTPGAVLTEHVDDLLRLVDHPWDLLANAALDLLLATEDTGSGALLRDRVPLLRPRRREHAAISGVYLAEDPVRAVEDLMKSSDGLTRAGAAAAAALLVEDGFGAAGRAVERARKDSDFTVRLAAGSSQGTALGAEHWSCPRCSALQPVGGLDCPSCPSGARPGDHRVEEPHGME